MGNAVGPFLAIFEFYKDGELTSDTDGGPIYVVIGAGIFLVIGLSLLGYRVIRTVGSKIAKMTFVAGFSAQFATALIVIVCTSFGFPVSTSHTMVGSVVGMGAYLSWRDVDKRVAGRILNWVGCNNFYWTSWNFGYLLST
mmetsp:Transcript_23914/g.32674  ORF Transcript_23914/g.32674 Transcript_23914/m.32674 type:complete len:140 (+) Transcript_23914:1605-2024(+)